MNDNWKLNRPDLKYSNYFQDVPTVQSTSNQKNTKSIEKATWILLALCCIPFIGGFFALATLVLGIILIARDRLTPGLIAVIAAPVMSAAITFFVFFFFIAAAGTAAVHKFEQDMKNLPTIPAPPPTR